MEREGTEELVDAVVVGAGFAGLYALYRLRQMGCSTRAYEAGGGVGGTWFWNRYPGARCDAPSLNYCYSFSSELLDEWNWSEMYAAQPEIERYANYVADKFELRSDIRFNTTVTSASWDELDSCWTIETDTGERTRARFLFMGTGSYSATLRPDILGLDSFQGEMVYTSRWPTEPVDFASKRVAVIGTGSSGAQTVTALAQGNLEHLHVFQRTANFSLPSNNAPMDRDFEREYKNRYAQTWEQLRWSGSGVDYWSVSGADNGEPPNTKIGQMTDAEFADYMDGAWPRGGPLIVLEITDAQSDENANHRLAEYVNARIRDRVSDKTVAELLTARNQYWGTRRIIIESGYYEAFNQENVTLVDVSNQPIEIVPSGIRMGEKRYELDVIVLATGFDTGTGALTSIDLVGRNGCRIRDKWANGPCTYLGMMATEFPNMFVFYGPGSPSLRANAVLCIEQQVDWACDLLEWMRDRGLESVEPTAEAEQAWTDHVADAADSTLLTKDDTQYVGSNVPGKPRVYLCYVGGFGRYRRMCDDVAANEFEGCVLRTGDGTVQQNAREWSGPPAGDEKPVGSTII